jgi:hypothetical protein
VSDGVGVMVGVMVGVEVLAAEVGSSGALCSGLSEQRVGEHEQCGENPEEENEEKQSRFALVVFLDEQANRLVNTRHVPSLAGLLTCKGTESAWDRRKAADVSGTGGG